MNKFKNLKISINIDGIARIIIDDPKTYNSLSSETINSLLKAFKYFNFDKKSKIIIIEGSGKGFSAGHNLREIQAIKSRASYKKLFSLCSKLMLEITNHQKPIIAKVHGAAFAAGCQLVSSCDLAYSSSSSIFSTPGINIGLFCSTPMVALSRKVNRKHSMKMLLTGESIKASYAKEIGLINDFFPKKKLENEVYKIAKLIASKSNLVLKFGKNAFYKQLEMPLDKAYKYTSEVMVQNMLSLDAKEGISAFIEKRSPIWKNK
ncbi:enoyl-CoA hydratase [Alphaproteobacteria bacterium]|nr:enoyl-CoA hydratase [Alphaproteobacteria bacterium]